MIFEKAIVLILFLCLRVGDCVVQFVQSINPPLWCQQGSRPASAWHISYKWQLHHYSTG